MTITALAPLTLLDRCDRCGAQAYVRTELNDLELLWCRHHFEAHGPRLLEAGAVVLVDNRSALEG